MRRAANRPSVVSMKLNEKLEAAFNDQITLEFEASLVYRQLALELELKDLPGMPAWLRHQADEENVHANKFIHHVARTEERRGGKAGVNQCRSRWSRYT